MASIRPLLKVQAASTRLVVVFGGSEWVTGGVERFCERAVERLQRRGQFRTEHWYANSAVLVGGSRVSKGFWGVGSLIRLMLACLIKRHTFACMFNVGNGVDIVSAFVLARLGMKSMAAFVHTTDGFSHYESRVLLALLRDLAKRVPVFALAESQRIFLDSNGIVTKDIAPHLLPGSALGANGKPGPRKAVVFAGRLTDEKGFSDFLYVADNLTYNGSYDVEFVAAGALVPDLAVRLREIAPRVTFSGLLDEKELSALFHRTAVLVFPSQFDMFPLVVLEALACGAAVVGYRIPSLTEMQEKFGNITLVPSGNRQLLVEAVERCLKGGIPPSEDAAKRVKAEYSLERTEEWYLSTVDMLFDS